MRVTTTMGDGSVDDVFLRIWLNDPGLLHREFLEIVEPPSSATG
jgi:hypothetical protein